jgi:hypothetical protein
MDGQVNSRERIVVKSNKEHFFSNATEESRHRHTTQSGSRRCTSACPPRASPYYCTAPRQGMVTAASGNRGEGEQGRLGQGALYHVPIQQRYSCLRPWVASSDPGVRTEHTKAAKHHPAVASADSGSQVNLGQDSASRPDEIQEQQRVEWW